MSDRNVTYIRRNLPLYYAMKTLMGGEPDCNRRTIYRHTPGGDFPIVQFINNDGIWTDELDKELDICLKALIAAKKENPDPEYGNKFRFCEKCKHYHHASINGHHRDAWQFTKEDLDNRFAEGWIDVS